MGMAMCGGTALLRQKLGPSSNSTEDIPGRPEPRTQLPDNPTAPCVPSDTSAHTPGGCPARAAEAGVLCLDALIHVCGTKLLKGQDLEIFPKLLF